MKNLTALVAILIGLFVVAESVNAAEPGAWSRGRSFQYYETVNFSTDNLSTTSEVTLFTIESGNVVEGSLIKVTTANGADASPTVTMDIGGSAYDSTQSISATGGFPTDSQSYISTDSAVTLDGNVQLTSGVLEVYVWGWTPTKPN